MIYDTLFTDNTEETVKDKTRAYMGGIFDAEGCVRLAIHRRSNKNHYAAKIFLSNQSRALMQWSVKHFGGNFVLNKNNGKGKEWYIWYLQSFSAVERFLDTVLPHLIVKREQAECMLEFLKNRDNLSDIQKHEYYQKLKDMKLGGSVTTETPGNYIKARSAYLAGFFDGEGCIRVNKTVSRSLTNYHLFATVTNNCVPILMLYEQEYGGAINRKGNGPCYYWSLYKKSSIEKFLLDSLPYLVVKKDEALISLEYTRLGHHEVCPEKRDQIYRDLVALKQFKIQSELMGDHESDTAGTL